MEENSSILQFSVKHTSDVFVYHRLMNTGELIRTLRKAKGLTQDDLGKQVGVSGKAVSLWENGETENIKNVTLFLLADALGTQAEYLVFGPDGRPKKNSFHRHFQAKDNDNKA